jgi:hypothetical protein
MNTLSQALREYLTMRRSLGFRLRRVAPRLLDFVTFMEQLARASGAPPANFKQDFRPRAPPAA